MKMNKCVSIMCGVGETYDPSTWLLDPTIPKELDGGINPETGERLWSSVSHERLTTPITGWPEGSIKA
jgi:hypothetical protein